MVVLRLKNNHPLRLPLGCTNDKKKENGCQAKRTPKNTETLIFNDWKLHLYIKIYLSIVIGRSLLFPKTNQPKVQFDASPHKFLLEASPKG